MPHLLSYCISIFCMAVLYFKLNIKSVYVRYNSRHIFTIHFFKLIPVNSLEWQLMVAYLRSPWSEELSIVHGKPYIMLFLITVIITIIPFITTENAYCCSPVWSTTPGGIWQGCHLPKPVEIIKNHLRLNIETTIHIIKYDLRKVMSIGLSCESQKTGFQKWSQAMTPKTIYLYK